MSSTDTDAERERLRREREIAFEAKLLEDAAKIRKQANISDEEFEKYLKNLDKQLIEYRGQNAQAAASVAVYGAHSVFIASVLMASGLSVAAAPIAIGVLVAVFGLGLIGSIAKVMLGGSDFTKNRKIAEENRQLTKENFDRKIKDVENRRLPPEERHEPNPLGEALTRDPNNPAGINELIDNGYVVRRLPEAEARSTSADATLWLRSPTPTPPGAHGAYRVENAAGDLIGQVKYGPAGCSIPVTNGAANALEIAEKAVKAGDTVQTVRRLNAAGEGLQAELTRGIEARGLRRYEPPTGHTIPTPPPPPPPEFSRTIIRRPAPGGA